jgi:hypothetical protein
VTGSPPLPTSRAAGTSQRVAAAVVAAEVGALVGFAVFYVYEIAVGATDDPLRAVMSVVLMLVVGAGLAAMVRGWLRGLTWPRTPTLVWNALLLPVAWGLVQGGRTPVALLVGAAALAGIAAALASPSEADLPGGPEG